MWRALRLPPRGSAATAASRRGFANRKKRFKKLDEYDTYDRPLRMKTWRRVQEKKSFYAYNFQDMAASEVAETLFLAVKLEITSEAFWQRAATAMGDLAPAMSAKQLATSCWAFGAARWRDEAMAAAVAPALKRRVGEMKHSDLAVVAQSFARSQVSHPPILRAIAHAAQGNQLLTCKGHAMITSAFAALGFRSEDYLRHLEAWAAGGGARRCSEEMAVELAHARALLGSSGAGSASDDGVLTGELAKRVAESATADLLEPPTLLTAAMAFSRLRAADPELVGTLQQASGNEIHRFAVKALPALLDAFTDLYIACDKAAGVKLGSRESLGPERRAFLGHLTGRLARELGHLRPQDAARALQALDRLGVLDPYLLAAAREGVPARLVAWSPKELLRLLEAYAAAGNADNFMVPCLRRALLPPLKKPLLDAASATGAAFDPAALAQLDDVEVVRAAEAFAALGHEEGVLAILSTLHAPPGGGAERRLAPSCELALAATARSLLRSDESWASAARALEADAGEPRSADAGGALGEALGPELRGRWARRGEAAEEPDGLLLALCAFPGHGQREAMEEALRPLLARCSPALLPGLLLRRPLGERGPLEEEAEEVLIAHLETGRCAEFPPAAAAAALRALARCSEGRASARPGLPRAAVNLAARITELAEAGEVPCKSLVRTLQALRSLRAEPPPTLVRLLAEAGQELTPAELIVALRLLSARSVSGSGASGRLGALATRALAMLRSSRQAWELEAICRRLSLELGELEAVTVEDEPGHERAEAAAGPSGARGGRDALPRAVAGDGHRGEGEGEPLSRVPWLREEEVARPRPRRG